jgi:CheY-like chemotaxis protein
VVGKRVLLVEDEALVRLILAESLEDCGFQVVEAGTGDEAAQLIDAGDAFDLVVTDIQMPGCLDGIAVARHARRFRADIPVIYVTGRPESMSGVGALGPYDALVLKPYGPHDVMTAITRLLRRSG